MPVILDFRPSTSPYRFGVILRGTEYVFDVRWNTREDNGAGAWFFNVLEVDLTLIAAGVKVTLGAYLGRSTNHPLFSDGALVCRIPHGNDRRNPTFDDIGRRVEVWYFTREEMVQEIIGSITGGV